MFEVAPTTYHIPSKFDDIVASSSFSATFRRQTSSNKGLHSHYGTQKWMHDHSSSKRGSRLPRIPGIETLGGTSHLAQSLTGGGAPAAGTALGQKHVVYMREKQQAIPNRRPAHMR